MKREDLAAMGLTDEQIEKVIAENGKDIQSANAKANKNSEELKRLQDIEKEYEEMKTQNLSETEKATKALETANNRIAELERAQAISTQRSEAASKFNVTAEQAAQIVRDDGTFDMEALGKIISEKEVAAAKAKETEIANGSTNPGGGSAGGGGTEKTDAEKTAEAIGKTLAGANESAKAIVDSYL